MGGGILVMGGMILKWGMGGGDTPFTDYESICARKETVITAVHIISGPYKGSEFGWQYECIKSFKRYKRKKYCRLVFCVLYYVSFRQICFALKDELCIWVQTSLSTDFRITIMQF